MRDLSTREPINMRHLMAFMVTAKTGNLTKASMQLFKAQSAVSRSIRELEDSLSVSLLERTRTKLMCTPFGQAVLERAVRAHDELHMGLVEVVRESGSKEAPSAAMIAAFFNESRLSYLTGVGEAGRIATVAASLGVSQAALSSAIAAMEAVLPTPIFERTHTGMRPTKCGERLLFRSRRALAEVRRIRADVDAINHVMSGQLSVGVLPLGRTQILPRALAQVLGAHPNLHVTIVDGIFPVLMSALLRGDIDFIFGALRTGYAHGIVDEKLYETPLSIVVRAGHPLASAPALTLAQLAHLQWALPRNTPSRELLDRAFLSRGLVPPVESVETGDLAMLRGVLLESDMATAVAAEQVAYEIRSGLLKVLNIELPETARAVGLTHRSDSRASPGALVLMQAIRSVVAGMTQPRAQQERRASHKRIR